ncbi:hypothetical protein NA57DRAFT_39516 [Rhizodiscina lignyota]|uniref:SAM and PH domain-containing protein n=1 Tax=Rhizodiscina lignyota TaxID=1504668 RepID=A0A9P4IE45_9PEZI|nr:hypothetical protein NA57DRAFT_39516 [Rhizodiscina lignyota]
MQLTLEQNEGRRSQTTISTYDEVATPHSARRSEFNLTVDTTNSRSMQGPVGPQLFRTSTTSSEFDFDYALQLSPVAKKEFPRVETAFQGPHTGSTVKGFPPNALAVERRQEEDESDPRTWSAEQVAFWMSQCGMDDDICDRFESHDITGAVLMDMNFEDLKEVEIRSFGKRHQLWNHICELRGGSGRVSPVPTPFQDTSSLGSRRPSKLDQCDENGVTPITPGSRRRKARKPRNPLGEPITPAESISIVAIEQLMPKPHKCARGEKCSKWKKQQKLLKRIQEEQGFPISPDKGGRIFFTGDPGNASSAPNMVPGINNHLRPTSEAIPSVVASSDLLGPGEQHAFPSALQENFLQQLQSRDPQEHVRQFLTFQHVEPPQPVPITPLESPPLEMFPAIPTLAPAQNVGPSPLTGLQCLPKLNIPRSASAQPQIESGEPRSAFSPFSPCRTAAATPVGEGGIYRFGTPASEMDIPINSAFPLSPDTRDMSRSVPPNMQFRDPITRSTSAMNYRRGASLTLPTLGEDEVFSPAGDTSSGPTAPSTAKLDPTSTGPGFPGINHAGWMKKRRTKLLRHEWADHHFRLTGTQLAMHPNSLPSSSPLDTLNIDEYAVACSSIASSKLSAKFKALSLVGNKEKGLDPAAFSFQLVPAGRPATNGDGEERRRLVKAVAGGKTHHFAVRTRDERIDWMRELMLAKALRERKDGYEVEVVGQKRSP